MSSTSSPEPAVPPARHASHRATIRLEGPVERVFPLFEPEGERNWAPGWDPRHLWPADGSGCVGATFLTDDGARVWTIAEYQAGRRVVYVNLRPGVLLTRVEVACTPVSEAVTQAEVRYDLTALAPGAGSPLLELDGDGFAALIEEWRVAIDGWLRGVAAAPPSL